MSTTEEKLLKSIEEKLNDVAGIGEFKFGFNYSLKVFGLLNASGNSKRFTITGVID